MKRTSHVPGAALLVALLAGVAGWGQPGGIRDTTAPPIQPGDDLFAFSGAPATIANIRFVAKGYRVVARLRPGPQLRSMLSGGWSRGNLGRRPALAVSGSTPALFRCQVPADAAGVVVAYTLPDDSSAPVKLDLNGSQVSLPVVHGFPWECLVRLSHQGDRPTLTGSPILNMWILRGTRLGPVFDETHCEIATEAGNDPLSCGEFRVHVSYTADPRRAANPAVPVEARLRGLDVTQYDGYVISVKSSDAHRFSAGLKDTNRFSWRGGGAPLVPGEWCSLALPFVVHTNFTTAGDGVLKLAQLDHIKVNIGARGRTAPVTGEYWVAAPKFYTGEPPAGIPVAKPRKLNLCAITSLSPERRKPDYFEGISVQAIGRQGDFIWLGTDRGIIKTGRDNPGLPLARYGMTEGLVDDDVQAVYADGDTLWIGTTCGLSRFEGKTFQNFTSEEGLLPGPVMAIEADKDAVWLGMARGLARYDKSTGKITVRKGRGGWAPESTGGQGVPVQEGRAVYCDSLAIDSDGTLWHAAAGMTHSTATGRRLSHFGGTTRRVLAMYPVGDVVWCVTARGIAVLKKDDGEEPEANFSIRRRLGIWGERHSAFITCAYPERDGIWLGYSDGVGWFNVKTRRFYWSPAFSVRMGSLVAQCLYADGKHLWVGTDNGLLVFPVAQAMQPWPVLEYSAPTDLWAAGVDLDTDPDTDLALSCEYDDEGTGDAGSQYQPVQQVTFDESEGAPGSPGSLLLTFALQREAHSRASLRQRFNLDLANCTGIDFCARTDSLYQNRPRRFFVDVALTAVVGRRKRLFVLRQVVAVDTKWREYRIPFSQMKLVSKAGPGGRRRLPVPASIHLTGVSVSRSVGEFQCPGDRGRLWFDRLKWLTGASTRKRTRKRA